MTDEAPSDHGPSTWRFVYTERESAGRCEPEQPPNPTPKCPILALARSVSSHRLSTVATRWMLSFVGPWGWGADHRHHVTAAAGRKGHRNFPAAGPFGCPRFARPNGQELAILAALAPGPPP